MAVLVLIAAITLYLYSLAPGIVAAGDNAELITSAYTLGIAHPPGYPLFSLIGKAFSTIPFHAIAARVNLSSAIASSIAILLTYFTVAKLTKDRYASAVGAFALATAFLFWKYSIMAEVFALNMVFASAILLALVSYRESGKISLLYLISLLFGAGLANHHTLILLLPPAAVALLAGRPKRISPKNWMISAACGFTGLLFYLYLPIRASFDPPLNWLDPRSFEAFLRTILRDIYAKPVLNTEQLFSIKQSVFYHYWKEVLMSFHFLGAALAAFGLAAAIKKKDMLIASTLIISGPLFTLLLKHDGNPIYFDIVSRFYILSFLPIAVLAGMGAAWLNSLLGKKWPVLLPLITLLPLVLNFSAIKGSNGDFLDRFCRDTIRCCEKDTVLIVTGDSTIMGFDYYTFVEKRRPDLDVRSLEKLSHKWYVDTLKRTDTTINYPFERIQINETLEGFIRANPSRPFCLLGVPDNRAGASITVINRLLVKKAAVKPPSAEYFAQIERLKEFSSSFDSAMKTESISNFEDELKSYCARSALDTGYFFYSNGLKERSIPFYKTAVEINPWMGISYKHLGKLYFELGDRAKSREYFSKYLGIEGQNDPDRKVIEDFLNSGG